MNSLNAYTGWFFLPEILEHAGWRDCYDEQVGVSRAALPKSSSEILPGNQHGQFAERLPCSSLSPTSVVPDFSGLLYWYCPLNCNMFCLYLSPVIFLLGCKETKNPQTQPFHVLCSGVSAGRILLTRNKIFCQLSVLHCRLEIPKHFQSKPEQTHGKWHCLLWRAYCLKKDGKRNIIAPFFSSIKWLSQLS